MTISRHPDPANLMAFVAGTLPEPLAAVVAAHVSICPHCRSEMRDLELMGAALLATAPSLADVDERPRVPAYPVDSSRAGARPGEVMTLQRADWRDRLPQPIAVRYGLTFDTIPWRRLAPGIWHHRLPLAGEGQGDLRLLRIAAGRRLPEHGHGGSEMTLVLEGTFHDATGVYRLGDVQDVDEDVEHEPTAGDGPDCICLAASERPAKFKGVLGRLLQPLIGM